MAGKRLLDAALLFNATRSVANQHFRLRSQQLDVWTKTSTIAKAIKNQTDRVTLTVRAANALSQRVNGLEPTPQYVVKTQRTQDAETIPSKESVEGIVERPVQREGITQDHHYERDQKNTTAEPAKDGELSIKQEKATSPVTPDGTIIPEGAPVDGVKFAAINSDVTPERIGATPSETPLAEQHSMASELQPEASKSSSIPTPQVQPTTQIPEHEAIPEQEGVPEGINTDVFHSPRIKKMLGGPPKKEKAKGELGVFGAKGTPVDETGVNAGLDQETFSVRQTGAKTPSKPVESVLEKNEVKFSTQSSKEDFSTGEDIQSLAADIAKEASAMETPQPTAAQPSETPYQMRESRVPSSRFGRLWQYGGLATSMAFGAVGETFRRATGGGESGPLMLSGANMERLVAKLSRMRGAALKLGQMMSFQDSKMLPTPIAEVLRRVQDNADYMPASQRNRVLSDDLGANWSDLFSSFEEKPIAAASIGQVHRATLASTGASVAVKIQYPGVADSISSDLSNLSVLLTASRLLPKGLYLDKTIANARTELAWECDYTREAACQERFRRLLASESSIFTVPATHPEACGPHVLTADFMSGTTVTKAAPHLSQDQRDWIGTQILRLCLRELFEFRFMQTDPNWTNFLYNAATSKLELLDFGAARDYPTEFVEPYIGILRAASRGDRDTIRDLSVQLRYLTGHESAAMLDAHITSVLTLAEPFSEGPTGNKDGDGVYDFRDQTITDRVRGLIPVMVRERLAPPPEETYSLHRKLSGAFLMLARLGSRVECRGLFVDAVRGWEERKKGGLA